MTALTPSTATAASAHGCGPVSPWVARWRHLLQPGMTALDLACGAGRHTRWLGEAGLRVCAVDRDPVALATLADLQRQADPAATGRIDVLAADLENAPWPLAGCSFDVVLVTNYLWRPLLPQIVASVAPGGWLIYETFAHGQEQLGRPRNPDFLLQPGELLEAVRGRLQVVAFEDGQLAEPPRCVQRIAARNVTGCTAGSVQLPS
ncbi:MAG: class I SAM-dependent methyltransferase [Leptothrix sp. (in: b-proteobacteria)]